MLVLSNSHSVWCDVMGLCVDEGVGERWEFGGGGCVEDGVSV